MMVSDPDRVVAAWCRSGTAVGQIGDEKTTREFSKAVYRIPVVCNSGVKEQDDNGFRVGWEAPLAMYRAFRANGAPIDFAPDPRTSHECGDSRYLAIPFFDACLAARLPEKGSDGSKLRPVDLAKGWLAPLMGTEAVPATDFRGEPAESVWLPDGRMARAWQEYVRNGAVGDTTPPPAPTGVKAVATAGRGVTVTWDATADLESGVLGDRAVLEELAPLTGEGLRIGLSVSGPRQADTLRRAMGVTVAGERVFDCVQATWNLLEPSAGPALAEAHAAGLGVIVKEALANGRLTTRSDPTTPSHQVLSAEATRLEASPDALALAAVSAQP
jgi:hypothetical protein